MHRSPKAHGLNPRLAILLTITSFLMISTLLTAVVMLRPQHIRVGNGVPGGTLAEITPSIVEALDENTERLRFEFAESYGTNENIARLKSGHIDIAIVYEGIIPPLVLDPDLRTFARLYVNPLHIIATENSAIQRLEDISRTHRIGIPPSGVASHKRAKDVLGHYGIYPSSGYNLIETDDFLTAAHLLKTGQLDMAFFGGAIPIPAINNYFEYDAERFRFVSVGASKAIAMRKPQYSVFTIPAMSYRGSPPFPREHVVTIASVASLVGRTDLEERIGESAIYGMTKALFDARSYLVNRHPYLQKMSESFSAEEPEYPLFEGSKNYYGRNRPIVWDKVALFVSSLFSLIFLIVTIMTFAAGRAHRHKP